jgi:hypothetical protein
MSAAKYNISVDEYSELSLSITYKDADDVAVSVYDNDRSTDEATAVTPTFETDGSDGIINISIPWSTLNTFDYRQGRYTITVGTNVILYGKLQIKQLRY